MTLKDIAKLEKLGFKKVNYFSQNWDNNTTIKIWQSKNNINFVVVDFESKKVGVR